MVELNLESFVKDFYNYVWYDLSEDLVAVFLEIVKKLFIINE